MQKGDRLPDDWACCVHVWPMSPCTIALQLGTHRAPRAPWQFVLSYSIAVCKCARSLAAPSPACEAVTDGRFSAGTSHLAPDVGWRLSLGLVGVPAVLVLLGSLMLPETPSSLMQRGKEQEARRVCPVHTADVLMYKICSWHLL